MRSIGLLAALVAIVTVVVGARRPRPSGGAFRGSAFAFPWRSPALIVPGLSAGIGKLTFPPAVRPADRLVHDGVRRPAHLDPAVRPADCVRHYWTLQPLLRGAATDLGATTSSATSARSPCRCSPPGIIGGRCRWLHPVVRRAGAHGPHRRQPEHPPLEIWAMTTNVTCRHFMPSAQSPRSSCSSSSSPPLTSIAAIQRQRARQVEGDGSTGGAVSWLKPTAPQRPAAARSWSPTRSPSASPIRPPSAAEPHHPVFAGTLLPARPQRLRQRRRSCAIARPRDADHRRRADRRRLGHRPAARSSARHGDDVPERRSCFHHSVLYDNVLPLPQDAQRRLTERHARTRRLLTRCSFRELTGCRPNSPLVTSSNASFCWRRR